MWSSIYRIPVPGGLGRPVSEAVMMLACQNNIPAITSESTLAAMHWSRGGGGGVDYSDHLISSHTGPGHRGNA